MEGPFIGDIHPSYLGHDSPLQQPNLSPHRSLPVLGLLGSQFNPIFVDETVDVGALSEAIFDSIHALLFLRR
jgi:hypothetical protein